MITLKTIITFREGVPFLWLGLQQPFRQLFWTGNTFCI